MPKPIIKIDGFEFGILSDKTIPAKNGFAFCSGCDIHSESGYLQASQQVSAMSEANSPNDITDAVMWIRKYEKADTVFGLGSGRIYFFNTGTAKWHLIHIDANTGRGNGMEEFNDKLYWASDTKLGRTEDNTLNGAINDSVGTITLNDASDFPSSGDLLIGTEAITYTGKSTNDLTGCTRGARGTTASAHSNGDKVFGFTDSHQTFSSGAKDWHPMKVYLGKLNIGDGRYVCTLESDDTFTATALTLALGIRCKTMEVYNDLLAIGTYQGKDLTFSVSTIESIATLFTWNGTDSLATQAFNIQEQGIHAIYPWQNLLIIFAGIHGKIYQFNGGTVSPLNQVAKIETEKGEFGAVYPDAVSTDRNGNLIFGFSWSVSGVPAEWYGIYTLGRKTLAQPIALIGSHIISTGNVDKSDIYSMYRDTNNIPWFSISDNGASFGVDLVSRSVKNLTTGYWESQVYNIETNKGQVRVLKGVGLTMQSLTNGTIKVKYDLDSSGTFTTLGEIDSQNQDDILKGISQRAKQIQLRLEFECLANLSPKIRDIRIY